MTHVSCDNLFETLLAAIDKPYDYNYIIAKLHCEMMGLLQSQSITHAGGVPYILDPVRNKFLSLARPIIQAGANGLGVTNRYLQLSGDVASMGPQGFLLPRDATITGLAAKSRTAGSWTFEMRKNGANITVTSQAVAGGIGSTPFVDMDLNAGDHIQFFALGLNIGFPVVAVELAWRLTP